MLLMKKTKITAIIIAIILIVCCCFTGCSEKSEPNNKSSLGLVVGAHKFSPAFTVSQELNDKIYNVAKNYGNVSATVSSGNPKTVADWTLVAEEKDVGEAKLNQIAKANTQVIIDEISAIKADSPEVNTLSAIVKEANILLSSDTQSKTMVIYDTGLCTTGMMDFTVDNLLNSTPQFIANQLEEHHSLPDLTDIEVFWYGLGQTRGEQSLDDENRFKLKAIWKEVLERCNPKNVTFNDTELTSETYSEIPEVSIVNTVSYKIDVEQTVDTLPVIAIKEEQVSFIPDTAEFSDPSSANTTLGSLAATLVKTNETIYVIGSTASYGSVESSKALSEKRASTVVQALVDNGVDKDKLVPVGIGQTKCSLRVNDTDSNNNLVEDQAERNRAVFLVPENNPLCADLKLEGIL